MRIPAKPPAEPGEWQIDEQGKRYRMVGTVKEYEMMINGIPAAAFHDMKRREREEKAAKYEAAQREAERAAALRRNCPFRDSQSNNTECHREKCALFVGEGCTLARLEAEQDTAGRICPFDRFKKSCRKDCALYKEGCTLTGIEHITESEEK